MKKWKVESSISRRRCHFVFLEKNGNDMKTTGSMFGEIFWLTMSLVHASRRRFNFSRCSSTPLSNECYKFKRLSNKKETVGEVPMNLHQRFQSANQAYHQHRLPLKIYKIFKKKRRRKHARH